MSDCAVLFSGGTDSLCAAALAADRHERIHLLTYYESATRGSPWPVGNYERLCSKFGRDRLQMAIFSTDAVVRRLSYRNYLRSLFRHHYFNLATPGLSSLSWHLRTILYCLERKINYVYDGMTRELLHLPGHMPEIRALFRDLYRDFGIEFSSPVIDWDVPEDQRFVDRLIVDRHGFSALPGAKRRTTGDWLYNNGLLPNRNVKGSAFDRAMQHDCYPFVVYNILVFWFADPAIGFDRFKAGLREFMVEKTAIGRELIVKSLECSDFDLLRTPNEFPHDAPMLKNAIAITRHGWKN